MSDLADLAARAKTSITEHWKSCEEGGLPHTRDNLCQVQDAFDQFFLAMSRIDGDDKKSAALVAIEALYAELNRINSAHDQGLLETDERELLVPIVMEAVEAVGLSLDPFDDGEPGGEFRDF